MIIDLIWIITSYVIGSIPFGVLFANIFCGIDPRTLGSGNVGATNITRICGRKLGLITLFFDVLKGFFPVVIATYLSESPFMYTMTGLAAIMGHLYSCFLHFKGGKAVATSIGVLIPIAFFQLLLAAILCTFFIWRSGFVSLGSLVLVTSLPIILFITGKFAYIPLSLIIMALIFWSHKQNIQRLIKGEEKVWKHSESI